MSKSTIFVGVLAAGALVAAGGNALFTYVQTKPRAAVNANLGAFDLTTVAGHAVNAELGEAAVELSHTLKGGNTTLVWEMAKNKPSGDRQEFDGTWDTLTGGLVFNAKTQTLEALEVVIAVDSVTGFGTAHPAPTTLTETLRGNTPGMPAWFNIDEHPQATYAADTVTARDAVDAAAGVFDNAPDNWTHLVSGRFTLNGTTIDLSIPAVVTFIGEDVSVELAFQIDRSVFGIDGTIVGGWEVEDTAYLTASIESAPKGDALLAALQAQAEAISGNSAQIADLYKAQNQVADLQSQLAKLTDELQTLKKTGVAAAGPAVDLSALAKAYTDKIAYPEKDPIAFEMVLVPGEGEVGPFYMAKHEVTWAMFYDWAYSSDIDPATSAKLQAKYLRPSPLYEDCNQLKLGLGNRPALSMSRTTAEGFAKWVSEQTGKTYRLPTDAEWQVAVKLGGGIPEGDALLEQAVLSDNAAFQEEPPFLELTGLVGTKAPNALGIHDLLGNAAEWVTDTGSDRFVRGGHFLLPAEELTADWKGLEDQGVWNETYPQLPVSKFWYRDHYYQGFRLVADVQ